MSFSKQNAVAAAISMALLLLTSPLAVAAGAEAEAEAITPFNTCETPIPWALCFGKTYICIPLCVGLHYTGGFCQEQQQQMSESVDDAEPAGFSGAICVCTKQCVSEAEAEAGGPSHPPVQPPLGMMRGIGMLN